MAEPSVITNDEEAFALLQRWLRYDHLPDVEFVGWPTLRITVKGDDYDSSLNSSQMAALVEFKRTIGRAYSVLTHGAYDMRKLRQEEEDELEFVARVSPGSSVSDIDLSPLIHAFASAVDTHPAVSLAAAIVIGLLFVSRPIILKHYENRSKQLDIEERKKLMDFALSAREQSRYEIFDQAATKLEQKHPQFAQVLPGAQHAFWKLASASLDADTLEIAGIKLSQDDLELLSERRKNRPSDVREAEGVFRVVGIRKDGRRYRIQLESKKLSVTAVFGRPHLTDAKIARLFGHMSNSQRIFARLEIRVIDKAQMGARLTYFSLHQENDSDNE